MKKIKIIFAVFILSLIISNKVAGQCTPASPIDDCLDLSIGMPTSVSGCVGTTVTVTPVILGSAYSAIDHYSWTPAGATPSIGVGNPPPTTFTVLPSATTYTLSTFGFGPEEIVNGDFSAGTSSWCHGPHYSIGPMMCFSSYQMSINTDLYPVWNNSGPHFYDVSHTIAGRTGPFNMLMVNGNAVAPGGTAPVPETAWQQNLSHLCPGKTYNFSAYYANLLTAPTCSLQITINGTVIGTYTATNLLTWNQITFNWVCSASGTAAIKITDLNTSWFYNDFALDEISLKRVTNDVQTITVNPIAYPIVTLSASPNPACEGDNITLTGTATAATAPYSFSGPAITGVATTSSLSYTLPGISLTDIGTYNFSADNSGCVSSTSVYLDVNPAGFAYITGCTDSACLGNTSTFTIVGTQGSTVTYFDGTSYTIITLPYSGCSSCFTSYTVTTPPLTGPTTYSLTSVVSFLGCANILPLSSSCTIYPYTQPFISVSYAFTGWQIFCPVATLPCPVIITYHTRMNYGSGITFPWSPISTTTLSSPSSLIASPDNEIEILSIHTFCGGCMWDVSIWENINAGHKPITFSYSESTQKTLRIIPNPTKGEFTIDGILKMSQNTSDVTIEIVDVLGQIAYNNVVKIDNGKLTEKIILNNNIKNGLYIVRVKGCEKEQNIRFLLNR